MYESGVVLLGLLDGQDACRTSLFLSSAATMV